MYQFILAIDFELSAIRKSPGRRLMIPFVRFSVNKGNMVRKAIINGIPSGSRKIKANKIKEMTGTERMIVSRGRNNS